MKLTYRDFLTVALAVGIKKLGKENPEMLERFKDGTKTTNDGKNWIVNLKDNVDGTKYKITFEAEVAGE